MTIAILTRMRVLIIAAVLLGCGKDSAKPPKPLGPPPRLTDVLPDEATPRGLRIAQIVGDGLDMKRAVAVYFGAVKAPRAAIVSKTKIQVEVPPGADGSDVDIRVEIDGQEPATVPVKFRYREESEPPPAPE